MIFMEKFCEQDSFSSRYRVRHQRDKTAWLLRELPRTSLTAKQVHALVRLVSSVPLDPWYSVRQVIGQHSNLTALVAGDNAIAVGAINEIRSLGRQIPEDRKTTVLRRVEEAI